MVARSLSCGHLSLTEAQSTLFWISRMKEGYEYGTASVTEYL